jgi:ATPase subunit of ABC transporter with duplicated ATPase domains
MPFLDIKTINALADTINDYEGGIGLVSHYSSSRYRNYVLHDQALICTSHHLA